jgi:hypothetical protein
MTAIALALAIVSIGPIGPPAQLTESGSAEVARSDHQPRLLLTHHGLAFTLGAGTTGFVSRGARDMMADPVGAYADFRVAYGTRSLLGVEAAYSVSGRGLSTTQFGDNRPALFGNGLEGLLRINRPFYSGQVFYTPFAVAGLGWTAFTRTEQLDTDMKIHTTDHVGTIPVGLGCALSWRMLYGEARFMYRPTYGENGIGGGSTTNPSLQAWFAGIAGGVVL